MTSCRDGDRIKAFEIERRELLKRGLMGAMLFKLGGTSVMLSPRQARAQDVPLQIFSGEESALLEALGDTLVPGAAEAGFVHYLDSQLAVFPPDSLLMIRYLDVVPPYTDFYRAAIAAIDGYAAHRHGMPFADLAPDARHGLIGEFAGENAEEGWTGPPSPFVYFVLRADAIDVTYGTRAGFLRLGVPHMAHITPDPEWS